MSRPGGAQYDMQIKVRNTFCYAPPPRIFFSGEVCGSVGRSVGSLAYVVCVAVARIPPGAYWTIRADCAGSFGFAVPVPAGAERSDLVTPWQLKEGEFSPYSPLSRRGWAASPTTAQCDDFFSVCGDVPESDRGGNPTSERVRFCTMAQHYT